MSQQDDLEDLQFARRSRVAMIFLVVLNCCTFAYVVYAAQTIFVWLIVGSLAAYLTKIYVKIIRSDTAFIKHLEERIKR